HAGGLARAATPVALHFEVPIQLISSEAWVCADIKARHVTHSGYFPVPGVAIIDCVLRGRARRDALEIEKDADTGRDSGSTREFRGCGAELLAARLCRVPALIQRVLHDTQAHACIDDRLA